MPTQPRSDVSGCLAYLPEATTPDDGASKKAIWEALGFESQCFPIRDSVTFWESDMMNG
ncbi:hypothetical protein HETIRDRAFT_409835 [Heterobasidion irregulare TC 32-1]|uniref:Uncharacterized protein n=1 Tax=Heterobasidion irregulare (strain TC 32-1) TaxID=747525 RepID=W4K4N9_HETIT|nr:uncharacterized protein HETIRDRAFT_409835 [Heterobasidion irregulare TC 32-1]ETW80315.1 hypothetical protein HETIRDRAFT_409835 [Heterobasidion irregulare TC 32-1]